jgi:hypothetical protein
MVLCLVHPLLFQLQVHVLVVREIAAMQEQGRRRSPWLLLVVEVAKS